MGNICCSDAGSKAPPIRARPPPGSKSEVARDIYELAQEGEKKERDTADTVDSVNRFNGHILRRLLR